MYNHMIYVVSHRRVQNENYDVYWYTFLQPNLSQYFYTDFHIMNDIITKLKVWTLTTSLLKFLRIRFRY